MNKKIQSIYDIVEKFDKVELTDRETQLGCDEVNVIVETLKDAINSIKNCVTQDALEGIKKDLKDYIDQTQGSFIEDDDDNPLTNDDIEEDYPDITDILKNKTNG